VALFRDSDSGGDINYTASRRRRWLGPSLLVVAVAIVVGIAGSPSPFVVEQPGPVFDTLGAVTVENSEIPMIDIPTQETFPTEGSLSMLTVSILGNRESPVSWIEVVPAWFDPSKAVVPVDVVYPAGTTVQQSSEQSKIEMDISQQEAIAAALGELNYSYTSVLTVAGTVPTGPAENILLANDTIVSVNGEKFTDVSQLRAAIAANGVTKPAEVIVDRAGTARTFSIVPNLSDSVPPVPVLGILVSSEYSFPFDIEIQLNNVGGPSAGQMFALGIIDKLTPGSLSGGAAVAGTGTITGGGQIGAIGGIRQKLYGAVNSGAKYFLAPASNCDEVSGHIPAGLQVIAVSTLKDSLAGLKGIATGDTAALPGCPVG
jgi:PDZ domain-containing protein